jgi:hypothetical protein
MGAPEFLKSRLSWIFARRGGNGRSTRLFDELEQAHKEALTTAAELSPEELPVLGSFEAKDRWFILTTHRIVWCLGGTKQQLNVSDISDASVDFDAMVRRGEKKSEVRELQIDTVGGDRHVIGIESGPPLLAVWNVLKNLGKRARTGRE